MWCVNAIVARKKAGNQVRECTADEYSKKRYPMVAIGRSIPHFKVISLSVLASLITVGLKFGAYAATSSVGLLSDAVESLANVVAAFTALFALWYAAQPADRSHPYGHEKIEFFSSGIEGGLIVVAALGIAWSAVLHFLHPQMPEEVGLGTVVAGVAAAINLVVAQILLRTGKRHDSLVLEADGHHLMTDVWTSIGVILGLWLAVWLQEPRLDPLIAVLVALNILRIGVSLLRRSFDGLMDRALSDEELQKIRAAIETSLPKGTTYHALRTRRAGSQRYADYHLLVPGEYSVTQAHDCEMEIGRAIENAVPGIEITAHIEPIEEPLAWNDSRLREETVHHPR
jgi:cation diffusion facilitator family transporter